MKGDSPPPEPAPPSEPVEQPGATVEVEIEVESGDDFRHRVRVHGPPETVVKVLAESSKLVGEAMREAERARIRRQFVTSAHAVVFGLAVLAIVGLALDFANIRDFNTAALYGMGAWVLGAVVYFYLAVIKDVFGLKVDVPKPPTLPRSGSKGD